MTFEEIKSEEERLLCRTYARYPIALVKGEGSRLWDEQGKEYIDLLCGIGVTDLGHCNPELVEALERQARLLWQVSNLFYQLPQLELAERLLSTTHHKNAFFCNSGAEANEAAIKIARRFMRKVRLRNAREIITLSDCFHGRTLATLAATGRKSLQDGFGPMPEGFCQVQAGDIIALEKAISPATCAVMLECVQGEAGVELLSDEYLRDVEKLCRARDILLICDEVQCGLCRTGKFWAFQHSGIKPDVITCAKALANGLAMGAMLATGEVAAGFDYGSHATTFGGGALASAVAARVIEIMTRDNLAQRAADLGAGLKARLLDLQKKFPGKILEIRSIGLMTGIELGEIAPEIWKNLLARGFICNLNHGRALRLLPALTIPEEDLWAFADALEACLSNYAG